jgi:hypothetical protein
LDDRSSADEIAKSIGLLNETPTQTLSIAVEISDLASDVRGALAKLSRGPNRCVDL